MKKIYSNPFKTFLSLLLLMVSSFVFSQETIYLHNFGTTFFSSTSNYTVVPIDNSNSIDASTSSWTSSTGAVASSTNSASGRSLRLANSGGTKTLTLTFDILSGFEVDVTKFNFWRVRDSSGAQNWSMTINGISVGSGTVSTTGAAIGETSVLNPVTGLSGTVTVVITLTGASGTGGFNLDNFLLVGTSTNLNPAAIVEVFDNDTVLPSNINAGNEDVLLGSYAFSVSDANIVLEEFVSEISGTYDSTDVQNFKLWLFDDDVFDANSATQVGETLGNGGGFEVFLINETLLADNTYYFYVTVSTSCQANDGVTITLEPLLEDYLGFSAETSIDVLDVNTNQNGTQTLVIAATSEVSLMDVIAASSTSAEVSWTNPIDCFDEIIIVVHTNPIYGEPTGIYEASSLSFEDLDNPDFPGGGKVVYNGVDSPQMVTDLVENQFYFFKLFVRNGLVWSDGVSKSLGGVIWNGVNWSNVDGPSETDNAVIQGDLSLTGDLSMNNLVLESGILDLNSNQLFVGGSIDSNSGSITATNGTINMEGTVAQTIDEGSFTDNRVNNLTVNNSEGVSILGTTRLINLLSVNDGTFQTNDFLICESTSIVGPVLGSITGNVTVERFIPAKRAFRFMSSPVNSSVSIYNSLQEGGATDAGFGTHITGSNSEANGFDETPSGAASMFVFDNLTNAWSAIANTNATNLTAGFAYRLFVRGDRTINVASNSATPTATTLRVKGTLKTGAHEVTNLSSTPGDYNMIGNPYQAPVNLQTVLASSSDIINFFVFYWDPTRNTRGAYVTVNPINNTNNFSGSTVNRYLQASQSCFVISSGANPSLSFQESDKYTVTTNQEIFRTTEDVGYKNLRVTLFEANAFAQNESAADGVLIVFDENFENEVNFMDATKLANLDEELSVNNANSLLSFESRSLPSNNEEIMLNVTKYRSTQYVMNIYVDEINGTTAYLYDNFLNEYTTLISNAENNYNFTVDTSNPLTTSASRFKIVFNVVPLSLQDQDLTNFKVYPNPSSGFFNVQIPSYSEGHLSIKTILGQEVFQEKLSGQTTFEVNASKSLNKGIYLIEFLLDSKSFNHKIIVE